MAASEAPDAEDRLRSGRTFLLVAAVAGLLTLLSLPLNAPALSVVAWVTTWLAAPTGISRTSAALGINPLVKYPAFLLCFMPGLGLVVTLYFLWRAHQGLAEGLVPPPSAARPASAAAEQARLRAAERAASRGDAAAAGPAAAATARPSLDKAVAYVKAAGLGGVPDGQVLHGGKTSTGVTLSADEQPVIRATAGEFGVVYLLDAGSHYTWVNHGQLRAAGLSVDELHRIGLRNLTAVVNGKPGLTVRQTADGHARGLICGGQFEASLVLLDALWDGPLKAQLPNGAVVGLPSRDICVLCDAASAAGVQAVRDTVARTLSQPDARPLSDQLLLRRDGRWQRYA